jgi:hypothetical protein
MNEEGSVMDHEWLDAPIGIDAYRWVTRGSCRTLLAVVHSMVSCHRLLDVVDLVESDPRVQVVFTVAPDVFNAGVERHLHRLGALVIPWAQAIRETFDMALAASQGCLYSIHAPLMVMAHGAGHARMMHPPRAGGHRTRQPVVYGLDAPRLTRDGRVLASAIVLTHQSEREILRRQCPEALPAAVVTGDICFDRLSAGVAQRRRYRRHLGVGDGERLVVVSSTWGRDGAFGGTPDLLPRLMDGLPDGRLAALLHPAVWGAHGRRQVEAWTRDCREAGLILPDPGDDWRALIAAADAVIGDHGSVTAYAAGIGSPVLTLSGPRPHPAAPGSAQEYVMSHAGRLDLAAPIDAQVAAARPLDADRVTSLLTSHPGQAGRRLRRAIYRLLRLSEPGRHRPVRPVPAGEPVRLDAAS